MTDKELLELAAKAAGVKLEKWYESANAYLVVDVGAGTRIWWNPLTNDGDALRLAVTLGIDLMLFGDVVGAFGRKEKQSAEPKGNDPYAATRRAIVRAAAEIGRSMK